MATNKNAVIRYRVLDKCFSNTGRKFTIDDLLEAVNNELTYNDPESTGIKTRQLRADIAFMKSESGYAAPIKAYNDSGKHYYKYEDRDFSINNTPLNTSETELLKDAITLLKRFEGTPHFEWLNEIGPMLSSQFGLENTDKKVMSYDSNIDYAGYDKIIPLFNAIVNKRVLKIEYQPFNKEAFILHFHPHFLKQHNNRWFVFGYNEEYERFKHNMALDRIVEIEETGKQYINDDTDWEEYFYDFVGVTKNEDAELTDIELVFTSEQANYVFTKPLHPSQKAKFLANGELEVKLKLIPNFELEILLLSFGERVKVAKPETLKDTIAERINKASKQYT